MVAAAAQIVHETDFVVVGSQSILGSFPQAPAALLRSQEADIYPRHAPDKAIQIEGALGDGSPFHQTFGYYAHAVGPETAKAPTGWEDRLVAIDIPPRITSKVRATAYCLEPHDLVLSKLVANRPRDRAFASDALAAGLVDARVLVARVDSLPVDAAALDAVRALLQAIVAGAS